MIELRIIFVCIIVALVTILWFLRNGQRATSQTIAAPLLGVRTSRWSTWGINKETIRTVLVSVGCHALVLYFWPDWWLIMAKKPVFWIDHLFIGFIFIFLRTPKPYDSGKTKYHPLTVWIVLILI